MQPFHVVIYRTRSYSDSLGGELIVNHTRVCYTLELPWYWNEQYVSCIPLGRYSATLRYDKNDCWRVELVGVPGRSGIQIHIGNYPRDTVGCVLVGTALSPNTVLNSKEAYRLFKEAFYGTSNPMQSPAKKISVEFRGIQPQPRGDFGKTPGGDRLV